MFLVDSLSDEGLRQLVVQVFPNVQSHKRDYGRCQSRKHMFNVGSEVQEEQHSIILLCLMTEFILSGKNVNQDFLLLVKCLDGLSFGTW